MKKVSVRARVTLTVEVDVSDSWGGDCPTSQVHRQALESATRRLTYERKAGATGGLVFDPNVRIVGEPKVTAVLVETE